MLLAYPALSNPRHTGNSDLYRLLRTSLIDLLQMRRTKADGHQAKV